ncbi:MAG: 50S ribosomal protein L35 [Patescibacteria group bacterium]|jgi:ribosomal protein L35
MPKIKTHKATAKRFIVTKNKKVLKRKCGQDHFNAREDGATRMNKRRDICFSNKADSKNIISFIPHN